MEKCIIFCAGEFYGLRSPLQDGDFIIAADGGLVHTGALGLAPDLILGDFDSLGFVPEGAEVSPVEKDDTDAMLAVRRGLEKGFREFVIYGGMEGSRVDHTVANFQTLQFLSDRGATGLLVGKDYCATVVKEGTVTFPGVCQGIISLFCLGPDAEGVTLTGLKYPLENGRLSSGFPLGVSNHFTGVPATVTVKKGSLLVIFDKQNSPVFL